MVGEFIVHTGSIIKEYLDEIHMNQKEASERLDVSQKHFSNLITGKTRLTEEVALKLEYIFTDIPASYWLNYEIKYQEKKKREEMLLEAYDTDELKEYSKIFKFDEVFSRMDWDLRKQAHEMLKILKISRFENFEKIYYDSDFKFTEKNGETESIIIWLNLAKELVEIQNDALDDIDYKQYKLFGAMNKFKNQALDEDYETSIKNARKLLNEFGVYLVVCDALENSNVQSALTQYKNHPAILLTRRFITHDQIWFALMHEIGHLVKHYGSVDNIFITLDDELSEMGDVSIKEKEANSFARDFFISNDDYVNFINKNSFSKKNIIDFAQNQNVLPGVVVARLQHDQYIDSKHFNSLKNRISSKKELAPSAH